MSTPVRSPKQDDAPNTREAPNTDGSSGSADFVILEEEIASNYVPTQTEIEEYAKWLGMDIVNDQELFWIAREGLKAPLPKDWKPCKTLNSDEVYYFNFSTGESTWDHPCDGYYRNMYEDNKKKLVHEKEMKMKQEKTKDKDRRNKKNSKKFKELEPGPIDPPSKLDLKPLNFPTKLANQSITKQPLPKMVASTNNDEDEPVGPPPEFTEEAKVVHMSIPASKQQSSKSPKKLLVNKSSSSQDGSPPSALMHSSNSTDSESPSSSLNQSSSPSTLSVSSNGGGGAKKVSKKDKGFGSKKFGRGLAYALTNSGKDTSMEADPSPTALKATVLGETQLQALNVEPSEYHPRKEVELQEKHVNELRDMEERFNAELKAQRSKFKQSLKDNNEQWTKQVEEELKKNSSHEEEMDKIKYSLKILIEEKKALSENEINFQKRIEELEKDLTSSAPIPESNDSNALSEVRREHEIKLEQVQNQYEAKLTKNKETYQKSTLELESMLESKSLLLKQSEARCELLEKRSSDQLNVVSSRQESSSLLITDLETRLLEERRKNELLDMELKDWQRKCSNLEVTVSDYERIAKSANEVRDAAEIEMAKLKEISKVLSQKVNEANSKSSSCQNVVALSREGSGGGGGEGACTLEAETKLLGQSDRDNFTTCEEVPEEGVFNKPCVNFGLNFNDLCVESFDESLKNSFILDVEAGFGIAKMNIPRENETIDNKFSVSILSAIAGSLVVEARVVGFSNSDESDKFAQESSNMNPSEFLDATKYGECSYSFKPISCLFNETTNLLTSSQQTVLSVPTRPAPAAPMAKEEEVSSPSRSSSMMTQSSPQLESPLSILPLSPDTASTHNDDSRIQDYLSQIRVLESELVSKTSALNRLTEELTLVSSEMQALRLKYNHVLSERDSEVLSKKSLVRELESLQLKQVTTDKNNALIAENKGQDLTHLRDKLSLLTIEKSKLEESSCVAQRQVREAHAQIESLTNQLDSVRQETGDNSSALMRARATISDLECKLSVSLEATAAADRRASSMAQDATKAAARAAQEMSEAINSAVEAAELRSRALLTQSENEVLKVTALLNEARSTSEAATSKARAEEAEHAFFEGKSKRLEQEKVLLEEKLTSLRSDLEVGAARLHALQCSCEDAVSAKRSAELRASELERRVANLVEVAGRGEAEASRLREQLQKEVDRLRARDAVSPQSQQASATEALSNLPEFTPSPSVMTVEEEVKLKQQFSVAMTRSNELEIELNNTRSQLSSTKATLDASMQNAALLSAEVSRLEAALKTAREARSEAAALPPAPQLVAGISQAPMTSAAQPPVGFGVSASSSQSASQSQTGQPANQDLHIKNNLQFSQQQFQQPQIQHHEQQHVAALERQINDTALGLIADDGPQLHVQRQPQQDSSKAISDLVCLASHWRSSIDLAKNEVRKRKKEVASNQRSLEQRRATWRRARDKQHATASATARGLVPGNGKHASLEEAKGASSAEKHVLREQRNMLDNETQILNSHVNELKTASIWLADRGSKLDKLDGLIRTVKRMNKAYCTSSSSAEFVDPRMETNLNDSFGAEIPSLMRMNGLSFGFTGDDTIALTLAEINNLTLDLEDDRALGGGARHAQFDNHEHRGNIENCQPIGASSVLQNKKMSYTPCSMKVGPVGFGSGQGRFNYSRGQQPPYSSTMMRSSAPVTVGAPSASSPRTAPSPRSRMSHRVSVPQQAMSHASASQSSRVQTASERVFMNEGMSSEPRSYSGMNSANGSNGAQSYVNPNYQNVNNWSKPRSDSSNQLSWLDSLRKDVIGKSASRLRNHTKGERATNLRGGLAGAWVMLNESPQDGGPLDTAPRSRMTDALISPTRRGMGK